MKFISFIASTMLIALISQQSTMGLPLNTTVEEETCSKGFELIDGHCKPIKSELHENVESASIPIEFITIVDETVFKKVTPPLDGGCPDGMEHGEHGICQEIKSKLHETNVESTSIPFDVPTIRYDNVVVKEDKPELSGACPEGMEHGEHGICQDIKSTSTPVYITIAPQETVVVKEERKLPIYGGCPDGMEHGEHGICQEIKSKLHEQNVESTSIPFDITTTVNEKFVVKEDKPELSGACPEGMEHGKYGICQDIKSTSTPVYITIAPQEKITLKEKHELPLDGACPEGMEHGEHGICHVVKSKVHEQNADLKEDKPELSGACPEGMEHGEHGICHVVKSHDTIEATTELTDDAVKLSDYTVRPKDDVVRPKGKIVKPKEDIVEPKEHIVNPKDKLFKPNKNLIKVTDDDLKNKDDVKPKEDIVEPKDDIVEPKEKIVNPKDKLFKPKPNSIKVTDDNLEKKDDVKPKEDIVEPEEDVVEPKEHIVNPKDKLFKPKPNSIKVTDDTLEKKDDVKPKEDIVEPKDDIVTPKGKIVKPKKNIVEPKEDIVEPKEDIVKPKKDIDEPKEDIVEPKEDVVEPKEHVVNPKDKLVKPNKNSIKVTDDDLEKKDDVKPKEDVDESKEDTVKPKHDVVTKPTKYEIPRGCPEGTRPDERGYCLEIKPSRLTKDIFNPKMLLAKDGSCPRNYVMIKELCYYVKPKKNLLLMSLFSSSGDIFSSNDFRTKKYTDDSIKYEYVLVLADNSCPEGTEHSDYGLCRRRVYPTMSNKFIKVDGHCDADYEFLDGKCVLKKKVEMPDLINARKMIKPVNLTLETETQEFNGVGR
ncbi:unnamed protein product [Adineta steineri]|uniref:Uncharacterized protein n=3 Tax=Adineta steineri TaxID=433720 RepID=A0A818LQE0_9BILA|nr:unnamed protein product [Adineta steineri]CAF3581618.1 unnamed protein product [Adineta steineri]